jgi:hypothetical protein
MTFCSRDEPVSPPQTVFRRPVSDARTPRNAVGGPFEHVPEACPEPVEWGCDAVPAPTAALRRLVAVLRRLIAGLRKAVAALRWAIAVKGDQLARSEDTAPRASPNAGLARGISLE